MDLKQLAARHLAQLTEAIGQADKMVEAHRAEAEKYVEQAAALNAELDKWRAALGDDADSE